MNATIKYWPLAFGIANIMSVYRMFKGYGDIAFNVCLAIGVLLIVLRSGKAFSHKSIAKYKFIYIYVIILWVYQLVFGMSHIHPKTWTYLLAKTVMLLNIVISVNDWPETQFKLLYPRICYILVPLLLIGIFVNSWSIDGRLSFGFSNPNQMGSLCSICFAYLLQIDNTEQMIKYKKVLMAILLFGVIMSGSRAALGLVVVALLFKYRFSFKLIGLIAAIGTIIFVVLPHLNISLQGIDRLMDTVQSENISQGRELQRDAAWYMINEHPIDGNGIYSEQSEAASRISELGSHNAYLDFLKWFGYPLGLFLIASLIFCSLKLLKRNWNNTDSIARAHFIVVLGIIPLSMYEGLIWGVNEINNTLFFVSFAVLCNYTAIKAISLQH